MVNDISRPVFSISSAAEILGISVQTLRMYEREFLILPYKKDTNHRRYSLQDIERIKCIRSTINGDKVSIEGIKRILSFIPCWEIVKCSEQDRENCEAFTGHSKPCWAFRHKRNICKTLDCRKCEVYNDFSDCNKIKQTIIKLMRK